MKSRIKKISLWILVLFAFFAHSFFAQEVEFFDQNEENKKDFIEVFKSYLKNQTPELKDSVFQKENDFYSVSDAMLQDTMQLSFISLYKSFFASKISDEEFSVHTAEIQKKFVSDFFNSQKSLFQLDKSKKNLNVEKLHTLQKCESLALKKSSSSSAEILLSEKQMIEILNESEVLYVILTNPKYENLKNAFVDTFCSYFDLDSTKFSSVFEREKYILFPTELSEFYKNLSQDDSDLQVSLIYDFSSSFTKLYEYAVSNDYCFMDFFLDEEKDFIKQILNDGFFVFSLNENQLLYFIQRFENSLYILE